MFKKFRQKHPFVTSLLLAMIPAAVMMATLAFPMYCRWNSAAFARNIISEGRSSLYLAGEAALLWTLWTAFLHCGGVVCTALFAFFLTLEFTLAVLCHTAAGLWEFSSLCLFPAFWTLAVCVLAIPVQRRIAVWAKRIWAVVPLFGVTQYLIYLAYVSRFGRRPGNDALTTLFSTNFGEAWDFLFDQIGLLSIAACFVIVIAAFGLIELAISRIRPIRRVLILCVSCVLCFGVALVVRNQAYLPDDLVSNLKAYGQYREYQAELDNLKTAHTDPSRQISSLNISKEGSGEICVIVIGESATRRHMSRWGYERPTTPWLCSSDPELQKSLIIFENAYSCMVHTVPAVTMALSQFSNYDSILLLPEEKEKKKNPHPEVMKSFSLIEILNGAEVRTHWFSNQEKTGAYNNPISAQARAASEQEFLSDAPRTSRWGGHMDEELLPLLERALDSAGGGYESHVIFLHLRGSHWPYKDRAPADWPYLPPVNQGDMKQEVADRINAYDRSISYTDFVLRRIVETLLNSKFSVTSMLYFPDHGEDATGNAHNFDAFQPVMAEIPVVIWLSEGYRTRWPETAAQLRANRARIFTSDLICELALGLNHVNCDNVVPERQLTSPRYGITAENARFWNGVLLSSMIPNLKD